MARAAISRQFTDQLELARDALARGAWADARAHAERALALEENGEALELLGLSGWWLDDATTTFHAREHAYRLYHAAGDRQSAARVAVWLAYDSLGFRGEPAVANGWLQRARRLLASTAPSAEHGWLALRLGEMSLHNGDTALARDAGREAMDLGRALGERDIELLGLALHGIAWVREGNLTDGMRELDEASAAALGGEFTQPHAAGAACCYLISACERVRDYDRAAEWCERLTAYCERWHAPPLFAICRTHYAAVLVWRGEWREAEQELLSATAVLGRTRPPLAVDGLARLGELRRRQGRLDEAAELFARARTLTAAQLGEAALALDRDDPARAAAIVERLLRRLSDSDPVARVGALELAVQAHVASSDLEKARRHFNELHSIAESLGTLPLRAVAKLAEGVLAAAHDETAAARTALESSIGLFERAAAPFETATARLALAKVLRVIGEMDEADSEARAALEILESLGARHTSERARALLRESAAGTASAGPVGGAQLTARERAVLRLVAQGHSNRAVARELEISEHTVHRHIANILMKLGLSSRAAAVAYAVRHHMA